MSRARDIAIELFGEKDGSAMTTADVYHKLARGIVRTTVQVSAGLNIHPRNYDLADVADVKMSGLLARAAYHVGQHADSAMDAAAYKIAYDAQMQDSTAENEADRHNNLNALAAIHRVVIPDPVH